MFSYCGNNPVMGYDPTGEVNWEFFFAGVFVATAAVATVLTCGLSTPLLVAGCAVAATGMSTAIAAATEGTMVTDISFSCMDEKVGVSVVVDFEQESLEVYPHVGKSVSIGGGNVSYSTGIVFNYDKQGDYGGGFVEVGGGYKGIGGSICTDPDKPFTGATAVCATFSSSPKLSISLAGDYYFPGYYHSFKNGRKKNKMSYKSSYLKNNRAMIA